MPSPRVQYLGIENNYLELSQTNKLATEVKRLMRTPGRPKFVVSVGEFDAGKLNALLANFDLKLSGGAVPASSLEPGRSGAQPLRGGVRGPEACRAAVVPAKAGTHTPCPLDRLP